MWTTLGLVCICVHFGCATADPEWCEENVLLPRAQAHLRNRTLKKTQMSQNTRVALISDLLQQENPEEAINIEFSQQEMLSIKMGSLTPASCQWSASCDRPNPEIDWRS